jgi:hypothetical protein
VPGPALTPPIIDASGAPAKALLWESTLVACIRCFNGYSTCAPLATCRGACVGFCHAIFLDALQLACGVHAMFMRHMDTPSIWREAGVIRTQCVYFNRIRFYLLCP